MNVPAGRWRPGRGIRFADSEAVRWAIASLPLTALAGAIYLFFEWLFFITKPSPTGALPFSMQVLVLIQSPLPMVPWLLGIQATASLISIVGYPKARGVALAPASGVLGILLLVLVDNFTYTLFGFGILTAGEALRIVYATLLALLIATAGWKLSKWLSDGFRRRRFVDAALLTVLLAFVPVEGSRGAPDQPRSSLPEAVQPSARRVAARPNVFFVGIDGVEVSMLSAYGYERSTSPFLERFRDETLFFENAFSNAPRTHGSLVTLLTGRLPFSTRVTFPPTVLQGEDAHRHLPAILEQLGYTTLQVGMRHYADAEDANLLGFDAANYRWQGLDEARAGAATETDVFRVAVAERLDERLSRLFGLPAVAGGFAHIEGREVVPAWRDEVRIDTLVQYFRQAPEPWFVHAHLLDTHCCAYRPDRTHFAGGKTAAIDARDSQVRETDRNLQTLVEALTAAVRLDRTIVVIYSDHSPQWTATERVPLLIRFPNAAPRGPVGANVQLADVAPTMLDYLGAAIPEWMDGVSLLAADKLRERPIFGVSDITQVDGPTGRRLLLKSGPPNYGVRSAMMIVGNHLYELNLRDGKVRTGVIAGHTRRCDAPMDAQKARGLILSQITPGGYRVGEPQ